MDALTDEVPFHLPRTRWGEDWSVLRISGLGYRDFWEPIKHIPLDSDGTYFLSIGGEARLTYELYEPADRGLTDIGTEDVPLLRLAAHTDWHLGERWRIFSQLGYAVAGDRAGGTKPTDETNVNVWQLFVDHQFEIGSERVGIVRLGRQIIETANTFITAGEANNVRLYHQGLRFAVKKGDFVPVDAFFAEAVDYTDDAFEMSGNGEYLWGVRVGKEFRESLVALHALYLGWDLKDRDFNQGAAQGHNERRHTLMLWVNRVITDERQLGLDYYAAYQFGSYYDRPGGSSIAALGAWGGFEWAFRRTVKTPILGLKTSYFSGDEDPNDDKLNTFYDSVFGSPYFSWARDVMPYNLIHLQPNIGYRFSRTLRLTMSYDILWRASKGDGFYTDVNTLAVTADASDARFIGTQVQLAVSWQATRNLTVLAHLVRFWAGDFIDDVGGADQSYIHVGLTYLF